MTAPNTEPNSLPLIYDSWQDWRTAYDVHVKEFHASPKTDSDEVLLRIRLKRLGFVGLHLEREIEFIKENAPTADLAWPTPSIERNDDGLDK